MPRPDLSRKPGKGLPRSVFPERIFNLLDRIFLLVLLFLPGISSRLLAVPTERGIPCEDSIGIAAENDTVYTGRDDHYTHGSFAYWLDREGLHSPLSLLLNEGDETSCAGWTAGQMIHTPIHLERSEPVPGDIPYSSLIYFGNEFRSGSVNRLFRLEVRLGLFGPETRGQEIQTFMHGQMEARIPQGWGSQIPSAPAAGVLASYDHTFFDIGPFSFQGLLDGELGNIMTRGGGGFRFRTGKKEKGFFVEGLIQAQLFNGYLEGPLRSSGVPEPEDSTARAASFAYFHRYASLDFSSNEALLSYELLVRGEGKYNTNLRYYNFYQNYDRTSIEQSDGLVLFNILFDRGTYTTEFINNYATIAYLLSFKHRPMDLDSMVILYYSMKNREIEGVPLPVKYAAYARLVGDDVAASPEGLYNFYTLFLEGKTNRHKPWTVRPRPFYGEFTIGVEENFGPVRIQVGMIVQSILSAGSRENESSTRWFRGGISLDLEDL